jgi:hypothetical protein
VTEAITTRSHDPDGAGVCSRPTVIGKAMRTSSARSTVGDKWAGVGGPAPCFPDPGSATGLGLEEAEDTMRTVSSWFSVPDSYCLRSWPAVAVAVAGEDVRARLLRVSSRLSR